MLPIDIRQLISDFLLMGIIVHITYRLEDIFAHTG